MIASTTPCVHRPASSPDGWWLWRNLDVAANDRYRRESLDAARRDFRESLLIRLNLHTTGDGTGPEEPEFGWLALSGLAAAGARGFEVRT